MAPIYLHIVHSPTLKNETFIKTLLKRKSVTLRDIK